MKSNTLNYNFYLTTLALVLVIINIFITLKSLASKMELPLLTSFTAKNRSRLLGSPYELVLCSGVGFMIPLDYITEAKVYNVMSFVLGGLVVYVGMRILMEPSIDPINIQSFEVLQQITIKLKPLTEVSYHAIEANPEGYREQVIDIYSEALASVLVLGKDENIYSPFEISYFVHWNTSIMLLTFVGTFCMFILIRHALYIVLHSIKLDTLHQKTIIMKSNNSSSMNILKFNYNVFHPMAREFFILFFKVKLLLSRIVWPSFKETHRIMYSVGFMIPLDTLTHKQVHLLMAFVLGGLVVYVISKSLNAENVTTLDNPALDVLNEISVKIKPLTEVSITYIQANAQVYREAVITIHSEVDAACIVLNEASNLYSPLEITYMVIPTYLLMTSIIILVCIPLSRYILHTNRNFINMPSTTFFKQDDKPNSFTKHVHFFISPSLAKKSLLDKLRFFIYIQNCIVYGILLLPFRFRFFVYLYENHLLYAIIPIFCGYGGLPYCFINLGFWCLLYRIELTSRIIEKDPLLLKELSLFFTKMRRSPLLLVKSIGRVGGMGLYGLATGGGPRGSGWGIAAALVGTLGVAGMKTYKDYKVAQLKHAVAMHKVDQKHAQASQAQSDNYNRGVYNDEVKAYNERSIFNKGKPPQPPKTR